MAKKKKKFTIPYKYKIDARQAIGKVAFERLDTSPYPKSHRLHKRGKSPRYKDGVKHPCITYKNGYQYSEEYHRLFE